MNGYSVLLCLATALALASAQTQYIRIDSYTNATAGCSGDGTQIGIEYYKSNECVVETFGSARAIVNGTTTVSYTTYNSADCSGTPATGPTGYTSGVCSFPLLMTIYVPASTLLIKQTLYSNSGCTTATQGPTYFPNNVCLPTVSSPLEYQQGPLTITTCTPCSTSGSTGTCTDSNAQTGQCAAVSGGSGGYRIFVFANATSSSSGPSSSGRSSSSTGSSSGGNTGLTGSSTGSSSGGNTGATGSSTGSVGTPARGGQFVAVSVVIAVICAFIAGAVAL